MKVGWRTTLYTEISPVWPIPGAILYYFGMLRNDQPIKLPLMFGKSVNAHAQ